jgi:hypothetical protein
MAEEEMFPITVDKRELNAIIKALKHRRRILIDTLARKNDNNPHIDGILISIDFINTLIGRLILIRQTQDVNRPWTVEELLEWAKNNGIT